MGETPQLDYLLVCTHYILPYFNYCLQYQGGLATSRWNYPQSTAGDHLSTERSIKHCLHYQGGLANVHQVEISTTNSRQVIKVDSSLSTRWTCLCPGELSTTNSRQVITCQSSIEAPAILAPPAATYCILAPAAAVTATCCRLSAPIQSPAPLLLLCNWKIAQK